MQQELQTLIDPIYYNININYRNAQQITNYINKAVHKNMYPIGVDGRVIEVNLQECRFKKLNRTAIILKDVDMIKDSLDSLKNGMVNNLAKSGVIEEDMITLISVSDCRGLEFDTVYVIDYDMTENEKYVAYTRALDCLFIVQCTDIRGLVQALEISKKVSDKLDDPKDFITLENRLNNTSLEIEIKKEKKDIYKTQNVCQYCGGSFRGFFFKRCIKCGRKKDY